MPFVDEYIGYTFYFTSSCVSKVENGEPIHIHISDRARRQNISAKIWLAFDIDKDEKCLVVETWGSFVKPEDRTRLLNHITTHYNRYEQKWCMVLGQKNIKKNQYKLI